MEKKKNWLDTYLTPAKELVGYECYVSCDYEDKFAIGKFSVIIIKNGEVVAKESHLLCFKGSRYCRSDTVYDAKMRECRYYHNTLGIF